MLRSTHQPVHRPQPPPLPAPWTEHKAPTGHTYYYNPETKQSTYTRPAAAPSPAPEQLPFAPPQAEPLHYDPNSATGWSVQPSPGFAARFGAAPFRPGQAGQDGRHRNFRPDDRPKSKHPIPGHAPWLLIKTRLRRRFVHNPDTKESMWHPPRDLIQGLVEFDIQERKRRERAENGLPEPELSNVLGGAEIESQAPEKREAAEDDTGEGSDEYEEVEVTDSEYESDGHPPKRRKTSAVLEGGETAAVDGERDDGEEPDYMIEEEEAEEDLPPPAANGELGEDDMAAQLAAMGESYDLDPTEYYHDQGEGGDDYGDEVHELTKEEAEASFMDMLDDHRINPYATWENLISSNDSALISDDRYTLLPNMKSRRDVFGKWCIERIEHLKAIRAQQAKTNPRIPYLRFLEQYATPKLFWPEFKRKFKKETELKDSKLGDKDREKLYRDYIFRTTKMAESQRVSELRTLMKSLPYSKQWNRSSNVEGTMPEALLADIRYASVSARAREDLVMSLVEDLPSAEEVAHLGNMTEDERKQRAEREARNEAMRKRTEQVEARKRDQQKELRHGQRDLQAGEAELQRAL